MSTPEPHRHDVELSFDVDELPLRVLVQAGEAFNGLLREVARAYTGAQQDPGKWLVSVQPGSVRLPVRVESITVDIAPSKLRHVGTVVAEGLAALEEHAARPDYFTDRALEQARDLARLARAELPIAVRNGHAATSLSSRLVAHVDEVLGVDVKSYGSIEGALEALNLHSPDKRFSVYETMTGFRVDCRITDQVTVEDLRPAIGRRVVVTGELRSKADGRPVSIAAHNLKIFPEEGDLPSPEAVFGILRNYEVDG